MKFLQDHAFKREESALRLRWNCEDCVHFDPSNTRCVHGFPVERHLRAQNLQAQNLQAQNLQRQNLEAQDKSTATEPDKPRDLFYCKDFELI